MTIENEYPEWKLDLAEQWAEQQVYISGDKGWFPKKLWKIAENLPTYEVPIISMVTDYTPWTGVGDKLLDFIAHCKLVNDADMQYPILLDPDGYIADGRHRLCKAIMLGHSTVKVQRLVYWPEPDLVYDEDGNATEV